MTFGSLFTGIGGFDLGFERAGMRCEWQVENDPFCVRVLEKHWPNVRRYGDIKSVKTLPSTDVICGGFPCQPFSRAGKQRGTSDDRYLWPEMLRIIQIVHPAWAVIENVPEFANMALDQTLSDLENSEYAWETFVLPACAVNAPHRRDRLFVIAHSDRNLRKTQRSHKSHNQAASANRCRRPESVRLGANEWPEYRRCYAKGSDDGVSHGMDRRRALGNAVMPQIAEQIGRFIIRVTCNR